MEDWKESGVNVDSLWLFSERAKGGKRANSYHGNFIPQVPIQLIQRYTSPGDTILELFSGSGTTLFECESLQRNYVGFDINETILEEVQRKMGEQTIISYQLNHCDVTDVGAFSAALSKSLSSMSVHAFDLLIAHPPYLDIVRFTEDPNDLSHVSDVKLFLDRLLSVFRTAYPSLKKGGYMGVVMGDVYKNSEVVPLGFRVMDMIQTNLSVKLKGVIVKNIEGNRGKLGQQSIWRYRALRSDYFLFKHEYLFVFKKMD